jgi:HAD superfamily hydrolase (TIGR01509 family)
VTDRPHVIDLVPAAVIFDLDGVLVDSETIWDDARREVVTRYGGSWRADATRAMMGMSSPEWSAYLRDQLGVRRDPQAINAEVVAIVEREYSERLPLHPGAAEAVSALARYWPLALASSSNRSIIEVFLEASGLRRWFTATVSSEEVRRGKPAPDVFIEAAARLGAAPGRCVVIEDSSNGVRAGRAAGMAVIAVPNVHFPPDEGALRAATVVVPTLVDVTVELVEAARQRGPSGN